MFVGVVEEVVCGGGGWSFGESGFGCLWCFY